MGNRTTAGFESSTAAEEETASAAPLRTRCGAWLMISCCPSFNPCSFTFFMMVAQIIMFTICLIVGAVMYDGAFISYNYMGGPSPMAFYTLGAKYLPAIRAGQVHRYITPIFLHGGVVHLLLNLLAEAHICFTLERIWGMPRFAFIYLFSGLGGSLISCIGAPLKLSVGASGALFGILGGQLIWLIKSRHSIDPFLRRQYMMTTVSTIVINFAVSFSNPLIDNYGHLGGLIWGIMASGFVVKPFDPGADTVFSGIFSFDSEDEEQSWSRRYWWTSLVLFSISTVVFIVVSLSVRLY